VNDASPTSVSSVVARSLKELSTRFERQKSKDPPRARWSAIRTFSKTVRWGNTAEIWKERAKPSWTMSAGIAAVMSRPL
jgi:hypothetical protein